MLLNKTAWLTATVFGALSLLANVAQADRDKGDYDWGYARHAYHKHHHHDRKIKVDCDKGQTITKALEIAKPGTTIHVEGTCFELVTITTDGLTLDGGGTAIIDGNGGDPKATSAITIDGARNITISGFIVQHSPGAGIWGQRASMFAVRDTIVRDNALTGIAAVENSAANIADCSVTGGTSGIVASGSSNAILSGEISANSASVFGVAAFDKSSMEFRAVALSANNNGLFGLWSLDSIFIVPGIVGLEPTVIEANHNGMHGIFLIDHATLRPNGNGTDLSIRQVAEFANLLTSHGARYL